jgi:hypothetical protein
MFGSKLSRPLWLDICPGSLEVIVVIQGLSKVLEGSKQVSFKWTFEALYDSAVSSSCVYESCIV